MFRIITTALVLVGLAACASSPPETPTPVAMADPVVTNAPAKASQEVVAKSAGAADEEGVIHDIEAPTVAQTATQPAAAGTAQEDELVCRRIKVTGSHRLTRVCVTRAEIEKRRQESQSMVRGVTSTPDGVRGGDTTSRSPIRMQRPDR